MSRWEQEGNEIAWCGDTDPRCVSADTFSGAREIVTRHNAACDAYEARITELEADIACAREELSIDPEQTFASGVESVCFQIKGLRAIEETLLADLARANARIAELDAVIARVNEIARQPLHMTSEAFERIEDLRHMLFRHNSKFGIVDGETEPYETEASIARADLARANERIAELEENLASIDPVEFAAAVNDLNRAEARAEYAERLEQELRECEADLARANARIAELEAERDGLKEWKADLTSKVAGAQKLGLDFGEREFDAFFPMTRRPRKELESENETLRADLARTRAESLRVVKVGEPGKWADFGGKFFQYNDRLWVEDEQDPKSAWSLLPEHDCMELAWETIVQPVRLERWEDGT